MNPSALGVTPAPLHPGVQDALRQIAIGPPGSQSLDQILAGLGLPQLPPLPQLPGLPPLPSLDPTALMQPITDVAGHFGTGNLGMGSINPMQFFSQVAEGLTQVMSLGASAIGALSSLEGAGTQAAVAKASQAQGNAGAVTQQAGRIQSLLAAAAVVVQTGNAELAAIAAQLTTEIAVAAATPGAQAFIAAAVAQAATEAAAVVAHVRAQLTVLTGQMTAAGQPVPITAPPRATPSPPPKVVKDVAKGAGKDVPPVIPVRKLVPVRKQGKKPIVRQQPPKHRAPVTEKVSHHNGAAVTGVAPMGVVAAGGSPAGAARMPLQSAVTDAPVESRAEFVANASRIDATGGAELVAADSTAARTGTPMMPMGAGMAARAADISVAPREYLVNAEHGDEVVGRLDDVATPVVGGPVARPADAPDKALTL